MSPIHVLPDALINQIAAGEVVERPSSVVKELVENSIDAGARRIEIVLEQGGRKRIEIRDDGCGMSESDALLAIERHATSKIAHFDDLLAVSTLGFRGEALPSIASVSRFTMQTFDGLSESGIEISSDPARGRSVRPIARDRGTTISVLELFENVPARRKFLKSADAEFRAIVSVVSSYALPEPSRAFRLEHNGRVVLDLVPVATRRHRVLQILGNEADGQLEEIDMTIEDCTASGFVTRGLRYGSRRNQYFFVNGRLVKDRVLTHAANRAADAFDFDGHPAVFLFLDIAPETIDVNVHPAKTEVRFRDSGKVHVVVEQGVRRALGGAEEGRGLLRPAEGPARADFPDSEVRNGSSAASPAGSSLFSSVSTNQGVREYVVHEVTPLFQQRAVVQPPVASSPDRLGSLRGRVIGQYRLSYILLDTPDGLRLVDQHVAHERILYDRFARMLEARAPETQRLLTPFLYDAGAAECAILESHLDELRGVGFEIERFSGNTFAVSAIPLAMQRERLETFFGKVIDASLDEKGSHTTRLRERVIASLACQAAIKVHRPLSGEEMSRLVEELLESSNPYACPHGRPIIVDIRHIDIEKHFHRK